MNIEVSPFTQEELILKHLQDFGTITTWESYEEYGITRLSAKIYNLRKDGHNITSKTLTKKNRYGRIVCFSEYKLELEVKVEQRHGQ